MLSLVDDRLPHNGCQSPLPAPVSRRLAHECFLSFKIFHFLHIDCLNELHTRLTALTNFHSALESSFTPT